MANKKYSYAANFLQIAHKIYKSTDTKFYKWVDMILIEKKIEDEPYLRWLKEQALIL